MKHKAFTQIVAHATKVPEKTVAVYVRLLKTAGLLTSGARGVNAPEMTALDLTRLVISLCATDRPSAAVEATNRYRLANTDEDVTVKIGEREVEIPQGTELEDLLSEMLKFSLLQIEDLGLSLFVHWDRLEAELLISNARLTFKVELTEEEKQAQQHGRFMGISTRRGLGAHELAEMAFPFHLEEENGSKWEELLADKNALRDAARRHIYGTNGEEEEDA